MTATQFATSAWGCARSLGLAALVVFASLAVTSTIARADTVFDFSGIVGNNFTTNVPDTYTGLTETGTITIDTVGGTVDGIDLIVEGDSNQFVYFFGCPSNCTYNFNNGFNEFGLLDIGSNLVGYAGGAIGGDSWVALTTPLGSAGLGPGNGEVQYHLSGTVSPVPEPRYTALLGLILIGSLFVVRQRRHA